MKYLLINYKDTAFPTSSASCRQRCISGTSCQLINGGLTHAETSRPQQKDLLQKIRDINPGQTYCNKNCLPCMFKHELFSVGCQAFHLFLFIFEFLGVSLRF